MANRHLDRVLQPEYLDGLGTWPIEEIRERRAECQRLEDAASYLRRLVQTRLDILGTELARRAGGDDADLTTLLQQLPTILTEPGHARSGSGGRLLSEGLGDDQEEWAQRLVTRCCGLHDVESAPDLDDEKLSSLTNCLTELEQNVSKERRTLHDVLDKLQAELVSRYKTGRATVDGLLR